MNVFVCVLYLKHIEYWKCPAIFNKIVLCFMHPAFIEHHSSANNFFCSSLFCHSTSFLTLRSPFHLFVLVFDFSAHLMPVYKNAVLSTVFISGAIASMFLQPSSHFRSSWSYWDRVVEYTIYSNHILFVDFDKKKSKTCKTVNRIWIHKFWSLCIGFTLVLSVIIRIEYDSFFCLCIQVKQHPFVCAV